MSSDIPVPDVSTWDPRDASESLSAVFESDCAAAEERLLQGLKHEKKVAVDNFDSGLPFEGSVRETLQRLLPRRYAVTSGLILDRKGKTAGNCDIVVFDDRWFSPVKSCTPGGSGRPYIPVEGVYAVGEVKQTLSSTELDKAFEKLVKCHRLHRPRTYAHRIVENRESSKCPHGLTNPLFSFVLAGSVASNETFLSLVERFFYISKQLKRLEVVRALCVLGEGAVGWAFHDPFRDNETRPALFVEGDLFHPIFPTLSPASFRSALFSLVQMLQLSLFHVVLGPEDLAAAYSLDLSRIKSPKSPEIALPPDSEWVEMASRPCNEDKS